MAAIWSQHQCVNPLISVFQAVAGLLADARQVVEIARDEASSYRSNYGCSIPLKVGLWIRGWNISLPDGPEQVKQPMGQVDFGKFFFLIVYLF